MQSIAEKLIILQGNSSIGKTTTLLQVIDFLKKERGFVAFNPPQRGRDQRVLLKNDQGFSIAICTAGDSLDIIEENYRFFLKHECDVMVSACSPL
jgi:ABC-type proline/glycine betaine transport system ATPase subunit